MCLALLAALAVAADGPPDVIWLEGEAAVATAPFAVGSHPRAGELSGRKWLIATASAAGTASWPFAVVSAGRYDLWVRLAHAGEAGPFRWRAAGRPWVDVSGDALPHDLRPLDDDTPVGWVKAGGVDLAAGSHTLELHIPRAARFALDAVCLVRGTFHPDGPHKPGTDSRTAIDWEAAGRGFEFPPAPPGSPPSPRRVVDLAGTWQAARWDELDPADRTGPVPDLPPELNSRPWRGVRVPGELADARPEWAYCHRFLLRTRFTIPTPLGDRTVTLRLPSVALQAAVFVNGQRVGASAAPYSPFECDLAAAVRPGPNELVVAVKDGYYAVAGVPWSALRLLPPARFAASDLTRSLDWPVRTVRRGGLLETPTLIVAGPVVVSDVFVKPRVSAGRLAVDVTVRTPGPTARTVEVRPVVRPVEADGRVTDWQPVKTFAPKPVAVPAGGEATVVFDEPWPGARPWWPDEPVRYAVETTVTVAGQPADEQVTRFGFREWGTAGTRVTLNGVPWKLTADARPAAGPPPGPLARKTMGDWRAAGVSLFRYAGERPWAGASRADTLGFCDAAGLPVLRAGPGDGGTPANRTAVFVRQVRAERNSPAVAAWELPEGVDAAAVTAADPTRPVLPIVADFAPIDRPLVTAHVIERPPPASAAVASAAGMAGSQLVADRLTRWLAEGDRWAGAAVSRFDGPGPPGAWSPVCVLVKEWATTVPGGRSLTRTLKAFNDTRSAAPVTVYWLFRVRGRPDEVRGKRVLKLPPGGSQEFPLTLSMPAGDRLDAELVLSCERDGREVFRDIRPLVLVGGKSAE